MPCREAWSYGAALDLHACNYYMTKADKDSLVSDIFQPSSSGRPDIKYAVHGSNRGKSACVFQAVLHAESTRDVCIKHVHVAFHNNGGRMFKANDCALAVDRQGAVHRQRATKQGHALAVAFLRATLYPDMLSAVEILEDRGRVFDLQDRDKENESQSPVHEKKQARTPFRRGRGRGGWRERWLTSRHGC